ncbi:MAG TPA: AAA family ATPase [Gallionella sp.]|nr:AAA family ATPase [Gallionella sp.]
MALTRIEIHGYRGFREVGVLDFAVPNGEAGSGLTVLTGPNNAGKSCILECLRARSGGEVSFTAGTRNGDIELVTVKYVVNGKDEILKSITKGSSETTKEGIDKNFHVFVLPSRRAFNPYFSKSTLSREQYVQSSGLPPQRSSVLSGFEYRLFNTIKDPEPFNAILNEVLGFKPDWTIDRADQNGQYFLKFFNGKHSHSSDGMGEGIISIFSIVDSIYDSKPGDVVVIDEPELSLHPSLQKRVAALLRRYSEDRQIVVATHSPYFVDLRALGSGGHLARVTTTDSMTKIHQLGASAKESIRNLSEGNLYNPHVFGLDARELFFQDDRVILTEGQEDVLLYPRVAEQLSEGIAGNFFGWGVGGAGNIAHLCRILADLGFVRVAGLLDGDKVAEADKLKKEFPAFHFACIPAKDIRTKPARIATEEVSGLLDEKLALKAEHVEAMKKVFADLSAHMNS